ncbi:hypothetical protein HR12_28440 [Microbacterium sp. SUBG005]|nr:hypothetical protein HR12_28440 [Microbacterium sp. SUBG005]
MSFSFFSRAFSILAVPRGGSCTRRSAGDAGLQLPSAFEFGIHLGEEDGDVGDPEPEQEDDHAGEGPVGAVEDEKLVT